MIADRLKLFQNQLDNFRYQTVTDFNCLRINYGLPVPTS